MISDTLKMIKTCLFLPKRKKSIIAYLWLKFKICGETFSLNDLVRSEVITVQSWDNHLLLLYDGLLWKVRRDVLTDIKFGVLLDIFGEPYQYWMWFDKILNDVRTFIDVGAYIGGYSVRALKRNIDVYSVEPLPPNYELLTDNLKMNQRDMIPKTYNVAAGSKRDKRQIFYGGDIKDRFLAASISSVHGDLSTEVAVFPLDELIPITDLRRPILLKIDVEGSEVDVLEGCNMLLSKTDYVIIEASMHRSQIVRKILRKYGLKIVDQYKSYSFWARKGIKYKR